MDIIEHDRTAYWMLFLNAVQMDFPLDVDSEFFVMRRDPLKGSSGCSRYSAILSLW